MSDTRHHDCHSLNFNSIMLCCDTLPGLHYTYQLMIVIYLFIYLILLTANLTNIHMAWHRSSKALVCVHSWFTFQAYVPSQCPYFLPTKPSFSVQLNKESLSPVQTF